MVGGGAGNYCRYAETTRPRKRTTSAEFDQSQADAKANEVVETDRETLLKRDFENRVMLVGVGSEPLEVEPAAAALAPGLGESRFDAVMQQSCISRC